MKLLQWQKEWDKLDEDCKRSVPFDQYFLAANKLKRKEANKYLYKNKGLNSAISKVPLPTFDGSSQSSANIWVQKLDVYFQLNPMVEEDALKWSY